MTSVSLTATYRLQMNAGFTLAHALERVDYFARLGVSHLYLSPVLRARRGSMHGYDVVDPKAINPEFGTEADLRALAHALHDRGMGLLVDIVPNHMGIGAENPYWMDVLTHGTRSRFARWFDIDWNTSGARHKVVLPVLGDELVAVLDRGEIRVVIHEGEEPRLEYLTQRFPLDPATLPAELQLTQFDTEEAGDIARSYARPEQRGAMRALLDAQHYRLAFWRTGTKEINYRRFFDVNDLAAVHVEDESVFIETHALILRLVDDGVIDALRVDHIDGLLDPGAYLGRLRDAVPSDTPIFVEKILSEGERLRSSWPVQGTTGYEFLNDVESLFVDPAGFAEIDHSYRHMRRLGDATFHTMAAEAKRRILTGPLQADVGRVAPLLASLAYAAGHRWAEPELVAALIDFIVGLPVYRTYVGSGPIDDDDCIAIERAVGEAIATDSARREIITFIAALHTDPHEEIGGTVDDEARRRFVQRLQQVSGPATAKGVEDTALYAYVPLVSLNEVGGAPDRSLDDAVARLHRTNEGRAREWPSSLLTVETHDTKRSADVRARIDVLSEMPQEWERSVKRWRRLNDKHRETVHGRMAPDTNDEYLIYQTLIALWPPPRPGRRADDLPDRAWRTGARDRLFAYMRKAARESTMRTSWIEPDADYEAALEQFIDAILQPADDAPFLTDVARLVSNIAAAGAWNALARLTVHLTAPGTPDLYQGDELWSYTLVDPDNRRPVDYDLRSSLLNDLGDASSALSHVDLFDPHVKLSVTQRLLHLRKARRTLFSHGGYSPLAVSGDRANHVFAFARSHEGRHIVTIVPRLVTSLLSTREHTWWGDTSVELPPDLGGIAWKSQFTAENALPPHDSISLADALQKLPVAVYAD